MEQTASETKAMKQFFDGRAATWDSSCRHNPEKIAAIVTLAEISAGSRVADVACGTGVLFPEILSRDPELLLGIDLSDKMIEQARLKFSDPRLRLAAGDFFGIRETGFDVLMIYSAYPHFPNKRRLAEHAAELLKTGGRIMIAHSESKEAINSCHHGKNVSRLSVRLRPVREEAAEFASAFRIDMEADTDDIYFFSGTKV